MNNLKISRDGRRVVDFLHSTSMQHHKPQVLSPTDALIVNTLMLKFLPAPVISIVKTRIAKLSKFEAKHGTVEYWSPMIVNMMVNNTGAHKTNLPDMSWLVDYSKMNIFSFDKICGDYLLVDYGFDDLVRLMRILSTYDYNEIVYACNVGRNNKVHELRYIDAVLEKERAKNQMEANHRDRIASRADESGKLLNGVIHHHTPLDLAQMQYGWDQKLQNDKLARDFEEIAKNWGGKG